MRRRILPLSGLLVILAFSGVAEPPAYHFYIDGYGYPGDPNGAFFADGRYHLMYLYQSEDSIGAEGEGRRYRWGHRSSADLLHWTDHGDAIREEQGDGGAFSGGAFVDDDGTCYLSYWMLWGAKGVGLVRSAGRDYTRWMRLSGSAAVPSTEFGVTETAVDGRKVFLPSADPSNIWKKDGRYFMLCGNLMVLRKFQKDDRAPADYRGDHLGLFVSDDLRDWRYLHDFYPRRTGETRATGWTDEDEDNMCPTFLPLPTSPEGGAASGKYLLSFISHCRGCQYYIGTYDRARDRFAPESHGRMTWKDKTCFAPEAMLDGRGRHLLWIWLLDDHRSAYARDGRVGVYALPRSLWLRPDGTLGISVPGEFTSLREGSLDDLERNVQSAVEIELKLSRAEACKASLEVRCSEDGRAKTVIRYDDAAGELVFDASAEGNDGGVNFDCRHVPVERAPFHLASGEDLSLRVFLDGDIVEVFANDRQAISRRVYTSAPATGIRLVGGSPRVFRAWKLSARGAVSNSDLL